MVLFLLCFYSFYISFAFLWKTSRYPNISNKSLEHDLPIFKLNSKFDSKFSIFLDFSKFSFSSLEVHQVRSPLPSNHTNILSFIKWLFKVKFGCSQLLFSTMRIIFMNYSSIALRSITNYINLNATLEICVIIYFF